MTDKRYKLGIGVTAAYLLVLGIYAYVQRGAVLLMEPNEFGDFLAGAASPLAFLWLVLGYLQQGEELRQNTAALTMQARELHDSVEQQKALVEATNRQHLLELDRDKERRRADFIASQPVFDVQLKDAPYTQGNRIYYMTIMNLGRLCSRMYLEIPSERQVKYTYDDEPPLIFKSGTGIELTVEFTEQCGPADIPCEIRYTDWNGDHREQRFALRSVARTNAPGFLVYVVEPPTFTAANEPTPTS